MNITFHLGLLSTFLLAVEVVTGLRLMIYYTPSPARACSDAVATIFAVHYYKVVRAGISLPASLEENGPDTARRVPLAARRYYLPDVLSREIVMRS